MPETEATAATAFDYANELVAFIREFGGFQSRSAAIPSFTPRRRARTPTSSNFVRKVRAGANEAITQYFYSNDAYFRFVDWVRRLGVEIPIVPGLMPLTDFAQVSRFSQFCGADIPGGSASACRRSKATRVGQEELGIEMASGKPKSCCATARPACTSIRSIALKPRAHLENLGLSQPEAQALPQLDRAPN